jgi:hypothetical protein
MHQDDVAGGGHVLSGPASGATSPAGLLRIGLADARRALGPLSVLGATRSIDNALTVALFRTAGGDDRMGGLLLASYASGGASRVTIVYDRADRFASTEPALIARATRAAQLPGATVGPMRAVRSPDGSVTASVPPAWKITTFAQGEFAAVAPDAAEVDQELSVRLIDPRSSAYQQALRLQQQLGRVVNPYATPYGMPMTVDVDPARAYVTFANAIAKAQHFARPDISIEHAIPLPSANGLHATELVGTESLRGVRTRFDGIVGVAPPGPIGGWAMFVKMISAPVARFDADLPTLAAVYNSYRVDQGVRGQQVAQTQADDRAGAARGLALMQQTQAQNSATFNASMAHARSVQSSIDRSTAGFTHYLNDTTVLENTTTGARATAGDSFADAVVKNDPQNFRVVPVSEYR